MIQDIEKGDLYQKELDVTNQNLIYCMDKNALADSLVKMSTEKEALYKANIQKYADIIGTRDKQISTLSTELSAAKKSKNMMMYISIGVGLLFIITH